MGRVRQRKKSDPINIGTELLYIDSYGTSSHVTIEPHSYPKKAESMVDTVGYIMFDFNPCFHDKLLCLARPSAYLRWDHDPISGEEMSLSYVGGHGIFPADLVAICRELPLPYSDEDLDDFSAKAEHHFRTAVDDTHSLLNFLIELIQMCEGNVEKLKDLIKAIEKILANFRRMYAKTGNYWLSWNFAIKPTIGDIRAMLEVVDNARKRLKWLKKRNNLDTKVKYRQGGWSADLTYESNSVLFPKALGGAAYPLPPDCSIEVEYHIKVEPSSWAWVRFSIPEHLLEGWEGLGTVWAAMAGLYNPLKVAWEAVPFSWLIDWFISKRTQLQTEAANLSPLKDAKIIGTGFSLKTQVLGRLFLIGPPFERGDLVPQRIELGEFMYECYDRRPGLPNPEVSPFRVPFKWYNVSILAALFEQKRRRG